MSGALILPTVSLPGNPSSFAGGSIKSDRRMQFSAAVAVKSAAKSGGGSLYNVLRVRQNALPAEIKAAYRTLAKIYHPDSAAAAGGLESDGKGFIEIRDAYATLSDPAARELYDLSLGFVAERRRRRASSAYSGFYPTRRWETDQCW